MHNFFIYVIKILELFLDIISLSEKFSPYYSTVMRIRANFVLEIKILTEIKEEKCKKMGKRDRKIGL
jgi:hypothetical protein